MRIVERIVKRLTACTLMRMFLRMNSPAMTVSDFLATLAPAINTRATHPRGKDLAARVRAELKAAVKAGVFPVGTEFSVTLERGGYTTKIRVEFIRWDGAAVFCDDYTAELMDAFTAQRSPDWRGRSIDRYSAGFVAARRAAEEIADRHNYNNSDVMTDYFDVGYYLSIDPGRVEAAAVAGLRYEADPGYRSLRDRAVEAAATLPANLVKKWAPDGVEFEGEYALTKLIEWAARAKGRPVVFRGGRWVVELSAAIGAAA